MYIYLMLYAFIDYGAFVFSDERLEQISKHRMYDLPKNIVLYDNKNGYEDRKFLPMPFQTN